MNSQKTIQYVIAMGGNVGDVLSTFKMALVTVSKKFGYVSKVSKIYQSKPLPTHDGARQDSYLNGVFLLESSLSPHELLRELIFIEESLGRDRKRSAHWGPRTIDLDIISADGLVLSEEDLKIPHPRMRERDFVLMPLRDVLPTWVDARSGESLGKLIGDLKPENMFINRVVSEVPLSEILEFVFNESRHLESLPNSSRGTI